MTKLLAIAASYRGKSLNRQLLAIAAAEAEKSGAKVTLLDYASIEAPIYRGESTGEKLPPAIETLSKTLLDHDGIIIATPEYNWSIPGGLKNLIDWLSVDTRTPLQGKTALLMCASPGARGGISGLQQLRIPLEHLGCWIYPQLVGIGRAQDQLQEGHLAHEADQQHLVFCVGDFVQATKALRAHG